MSGADKKKRKKKDEAVAGTFDRVRPRMPAPTAAERQEIATSLPSMDADGKRLLFSATSASPVMGAVTVECSACGVESAMTLAQLLRASIPSVHLPILKRRYPSYLRCPACGRRTWVRAHFRV